MSRDISVGALVRWIGGDVQRLGVVIAAASNGRSVTVHFDDGESLQFALPAENLVRLIFEKGETVKLEATGERGNVADVLPADDRVLYVVALSDGTRKTVTEDGVRPAIETDPLARMRSGELDSARSVNLRIAATRLLFAHQFDELSSLSNSRVEIKPHQVGVLHRVATTVSASLPPRRRGRPRKDDRGGPDHQGAQGARLRKPGPGPCAVGDRLAVAVRAEDEVQRCPSPTTDERSIAFLESENPGENVWTLRDNVIASTSFAAWRRRPSPRDRPRRLGHGRHRRGAPRAANVARRAQVHGNAALQARGDARRPRAWDARSRCCLLTATPMQLHRSSCTR